MASTEALTSSNSDHATTDSTPQSASHVKSDTLPTDSELQTLFSTKVYDKDNKPHDFRSLVSGSQRILTVFIRHFFCGNCQQYIVALAQSLPASFLSSLEPSTQLLIIGCGDPSLIPNYMTETKCPFTIYADPNRTTYEALGFAANLRQGDKPEYMTKSFMSNLLDSVKQTLAAGGNMLSGGKKSQNGGEVVWENGEVKWLHRMTNTADHAEIRDLKKVLGVKE